MASDGEDDEDTFVVFGNPLRPYEEDEPLKKQYNLQNQKVKDDKGRQRFHGAFTGGFSAGYFNTVGSKEGWTPSTFVSSREKRADHSGAKPEDFMDTEDLGEYGIAPRAVKATTDFTSQSSNRKRGPVSDGIIPGMAPLADLIKPVSARMGVNLLRKLGWKEGQGIGPRTRKKKRHKQSDDRKMYGCALPDTDILQSSSEDDADNVSLQDLTFAPKDTNPIVFKPKDDLHGLGYSGITPGGTTEMFDRPEGPLGRRGKKAIRGQAFGVGALEEDDDDIYNTAADMSKYDTVLGGDDNTGTYGWTAPTNTGHRAPQHYADVLLEGFKLMSTQQQPQQVYPPPSLPRDYRPHHIFSKDEQTANEAARQIPKKFSVGWKRNLDVSERREALGEKPEFKSVFDLISDKNKQHMKSCQIDPSLQVEPVTQVAPPSSLPSDSTVTHTETPGVDAGTNAAARAKAALLAGLSSRFQSSQSEVAPPSDVLSPPGGVNITPSVSRDSAPLYTGSGNFKPFARDKPKQDRYEKFLAAKKSGSREVYLSSTGHMTEWERSRETEEFTRAADLYRPMSSLMATRFTRAEHADEDKVLTNKEKGGAKSEQAEAAGMKMFGRLTRDVLEWHPDKLLCKRFNIPHPFPESTTVGLRRVKRDKFSVFNFLSFPGQEVHGTDQSGSAEQPTETKDSQKDNDSRQTKRKSHQGKPLAILATLDLRRPSQKSESKKTENPKEPESDKSGITTDNQPEESNSEATLDRPPMDIFKAVFGDSESDKSSSEDEADDESSTKAETSSAVPFVKPPTLQTNLLKNSTPNLSIDNGSPNMFSRLFDSAPGDKSMKSDVANDMIVSVISGDKKRHFEDIEPGIRSSEERIGMHIVGDNRASDMTESEIYGPPLPPTLNHSNAPASESCLPPRAEIKKKKKKHKEREKHKHKKRKSKHKKSKDKPKKKKKKKTIVKSDTSSSDNFGTPTSSDVNSDPGTPSSNDDVNTDKLITQRLKSLGKRLSAADFM